ncbi:MAG: serine/threonine-protein kinase [Planctomycetota bacterium]
MPDPNANAMNQVKIGSRVGPYRVERSLGQGGMSHVYYAIHEDLRRPAAIKILKSSLAEDELNLQRFMNEARSAASLVHPNIVQVYDVGKDATVHYIAQEYVAGVNLAQYLQPDPAEEASKSAATEQKDPAERPMGIEETLSILLQILGALAKAATSSIVHRDIKPENIMLTPDGEAKVADFGLARSHIGEDPKLTRAGTTLGTPMYMSPEQIKGEEVDSRSDLYSLGVTLFHMLAGRPPFSGDTPLALAMLHTQSAAPSLSEFRPDAPASLVELVERLLRKGKDERPASPEEVQQFLQSNRQGDLATFWPEQTVPLPKATASSAATTMQATAALQTAISSRRRLSSGISTPVRILLGLLGFLAFFAAGFLLSFEQPFQASNLYEGVPRKATISEQYRHALLSNDTRTSREAKWRAVKEYFPQAKSSLYSDLASIQLARALHRKKDSLKALQELDRAINDAKIEPSVKVHALITKATIFETSRDGGVQEEDINEIRKIVDAALELWRRQESDEKRDNLEKQINRLLNDLTLTTHTKELWLTGKE